MIRLVDLVLDDEAAIRRTVRQLGRVAEPVAPAVLALPGGLPPLPAPARPDPFPGVRTHRPASGAKWNQVTVYQVDGLTVQLHVPGKPAASFTAAELGMANRRKRDRGTTKKWQILMALCEGRGTCGWRGFASSFDAFKMQVSTMRPLLCHIFGIDEDPFTACTRTGGLRAAFIAGPLPEAQPYVGEDAW